MKSEKIIALMGRRDAPTDAVEEYCRYLGNALCSHGIAMELARVSWSEHGWTEALRELKEKARAWRGLWVFLQYTALAWSARGFPLPFRRVIDVLGEAGAHLAIVYHDVEPYTGERFVDKLRRSAQSYVMRWALGHSDLSIFTVPLENLSWKTRTHKKAIFIPVGANLPIPAITLRQNGDPIDHTLKVAVFGITGGVAGRDEVERIVQALRFAANKIAKLRLTVFGRNSEAIETNLRYAMRDTPAEIEVLGVLAAEEIVRVLQSSAVLLFVRGSISSRRGSAIAGIACGLPVIAYAGSETAPPITDAGVVLVGRENRAALGEELVRVLTDWNYQASLADRSRLAQEQHFSWPVIASRYVEAMRNRSNDEAVSEDVAEPRHTK